MEAGIMGNAGKTARKRAGGIDPAVARWRARFIQRGWVHVTAHAAALARVRFQRLGGEVTYGDGTDPGAPPGDVRIRLVPDDMPYDIDDSAYQDPQGRKVLAAIRARIDASDAPSYGWVAEYRDPSSARWIQHDACWGYCDADDAEDGADASDAFASVCDAYNAAIDAYAAEYAAARVTYATAGSHRGDNVTTARTARKRG
jgi:hypothetical protein